METFETELAALRARAETLHGRHAATEAAFLDAKVKLQGHLLKADLDADEKTTAKLEAAVTACAQKRDALADALGEARKIIADTERKIAAERAAVERKAASEKLARDLDAVEKALPHYLEDGRRFANLLEAIHDHYETKEMARFVRNTAAQIEVAAGFSVAELRAMVNAIREGTAPIPAPQRETAPVTVTEPAPEVRRMFALRSIKWKDPEGRQHYALQFEDVDLPPAAAHRALTCGAVVPLDDPRRKQLRGSRGGYHVDAKAPDLLDLDDVEATRPPHIAPVMASDPLASADFRVIDRSADARTVNIEVPRL